MPVGRGPRVVVDMTGFKLEPRFQCVTVRWCARVYCIFQYLTLPKCRLLCEVDYESVPFFF